MRLLELGGHAVVVLRVDTGHQEAQLEPARRGEAEQRLDLRAHVAPAHRQAEVGDVGRERNLLDERPVLRLHLA